MSLNISPTNLWRETQAALSNTRAHLPSYTRQVAQYYGKHYYQNGVTETHVDSRTSMRIENHSHDWLSTVLGRMVYDNPAAKVGTRRPQMQREEAILAHHALNRWIKDRRFVDEFELCARDQQFNWGVALVSMEPIPDARPDEYVGGVDANVKARTAGVPWSPSFYRISQRRYFWDPLAASARECRYQGHIWTRTKASMLAEAEEYPDRGWNVELIKSISADADEHAKDLGREDAKKIETPERDEVVGVTIWVKDRQIDGKRREDNFYGTLYTIALDPVTAAGPGKSQEEHWDKIRKEISADGGKYRTQYLREPQAFYGPPSGPYAVGAVYTVPDDAAGLGPITVAQEAADELNLVSAANTRSAKRWKRGVVVGGPDKKVAGRIKSSEHDSVFYASGFDKSHVAEYQAGGLDPQGLEQEQRMTEKLQRSQGLSDAQRGQVTGRGSATEVYEASQAGNARMDFIEKKVYRFAQNILDKALWYIWHSNKVVIQLGPDAAEELGYEPEWVMDENGFSQQIQPEIEYRGGPAEDGVQETAYEDLELTIEPYSMQRPDEAQQKADALAWANFVLTAAPMVRQFPELEWNSIFESAAKAFNQADGAAMIDVKKSQEIGAMMMGLELDQLMQGQVQGSGGPSPQFAGYAGGQSGTPAPNRGGLGFDSKSPMAAAGQGGGPSFGGTAGGRQAMTGAAQ